MSYSKNAPITQGEMQQFEKRMDEANEGTKENINSLRVELKTLTEAVGRIADASNEVINEMIITRERVIFTVENQNNKISSIEDALEKLERQFDLLEKDIDVELGRIKVLENKIEILVKKEEESADSRKWVKRAAITVIFGVIGAVLTGYLTK